MQSIQLSLHLSPDSTQLSVTLNRVRAAGCLLEPTWKPGDKDRRMSPEGQESSALTRESSNLVGVLFCFCPPRPEREGRQKGRKLRGYLSVIAQWPRKVVEARPSTSERENDDTKHKDLLTVP